MSTYTPVYPPAHNSTYVNVSNYLSGFYGYQATNPALSKTGTQTGNCWLANFVACKFNIDFGSSVLPGRIYLENAHNSGGYTANGIKDFEVYGTNSATAFANLTYSNTTDLDLLGSFTALEHAAVDALSPQYFVLTNSTNYRYIVLRLSTSYSASYMGIRHIEIQEPDATPLRVALTQPYNLRVGDAVVAQTVSQSYLLTDRILADVSFSWGLKMGADLVQPWSEAPVIIANIFQPYGNAGVLTSSLIQRWRDAVPLLMQMVQPYALTTPLINILRQPWALTADPVKSLLAQGWDIADINQVVAVLQQNWWGDFDPAVQPLETAVAVVVEGPASGQPLPVSPTYLGSLGSIIALTVEASLDQYVISAQLQMHSQADYLLCVPGAVITLTGVLPGLPLTLRVDSRSRNRSGSEVDTYSVELLSPAAWLDGPYAEPIEGEYSGMASAIAIQAIAGALPLSWETVDWYIGEGVLAVENRTPLAVVRELAAAVGAVVQSSPDGTIRVIPRYKVPVPEWGGEPGAVISEATSITQSRDTFEYRPGYNSYRIADEENVSDSSDIRFTVEDISDHTKQVRAQIPDLTALTLTHTGGSWVIVEPEGRTLTNVEEDEIVEIISGEGRTQNTVFSLTSSAWKHTDLGVVGFEASGLITAAVNGESLLSLDYSYEEQTWRITSPEIEKVQFILEIENG